MAFHIGEASEQVIIVRTKCAIRSASIAMESTIFQRNRIPKTELVAELGQDLVETRREFPRYALFLFIPT